MVKLLIRDKESIQEAVRRFRKLVERSGIKKEMRRREFYEKPSEIKPFEAKSHVSCSSLSSCGRFGCWLSNSVDQPSRQNKKASGFPLAFKMR